MLAQPFFPFIPQLHIPDGFLSLAVAAIFWLLSLVFVAVGVHKVQKTFNERLIPLMGIMAAFIFAAQMLNFPVAGGTSGHLLGGALAAIVLGPWAGILVMTSVIAVQALLFQDGGLLVMGANIFNMGILTALVGYGLYRPFAASRRTVQMAAIGVAAWFSVMAAALLTSLQLWLSGTSTLNVVLPAMMGVHALIGLGEALITVAAVSFIRQARPDLMGAKQVREQGGWGWVAAGAAVTLLALLLTPFASADPDGLERVAINLGFMHAGQDAPYQLLPDYTIPFLGESPISGILAGLVGAAVVAALVVLMVHLLRRSSTLTNRRA
ncbi:MAG: cobalamin biosynthesis protein CbiM [Chloroflexi bacterium]|nr:cobalamin biosynthesis protein CbiM [Chloroflexota bacterium]